jgi:hypothetical protein
MTDKILQDLLSSAPATSPPAAPGLRPVVDLPPITKAGVDLAKIVLWFIAGSVVLLLGLITLEEYWMATPHADAMAKMLQHLAANPPDPNNPSQMDAFRKALDSVKSLLDTVGSTQRDTRDFMLKVSQLILVSVLFPVLTALLGYIFGTQQASTQGNKGG